MIQRLLAHEKGGNKLIKVALCDDIIDYNKKMESYIEKYGNENHVEVKNYFVWKWQSVIIELSETKV